ncbi:MAG: hypothetical protein O3A53_08095 [Acidobacteria bacterium]|nr:hypothetical protein [Acidobacteriota bacterium]
MQTTNPSSTTPRQTSGQSNYDYSMDDYSMDMDTFIPRPPKSLEEAGVSSSLVEQLILKNLYFRGETTGRELARTLGLQFSVIESVVEFLKHGRLVEVKRASGIGSISSVFTCSETGRVRAREHLDNNQFLGPCPVPLRDYNQAVGAQRVKPGWMTIDNLKKAFSGAVTTEDFFAKLGPAVNSFKSLLIYGLPGNGKTYLAEQLMHTEAETIFVPYVI